MKPVSVSRRRCLAIGAGLGASLLAGPARAGQPIDAVVELFSSQSCRACPPGDAVLGELRAMPGVLALTFHVDYWDYLGWKDTFGSPDFSQRQYDYAKLRGDRDVFTPQMIVNGSEKVVASQRSEVLAVLAEQRRKSWPVPVTLGESGREIVIELGAGHPGEEGTLWAMPILDHATVRIDRGEMAGQQVSYTNVVRRLVPAAMWNGKPGRVVLPKDGLMTPDATGCVALLQKGKLGTVLGAAACGGVTS